MTKYVIKASINDITTDSRKVEKDSLFIAYQGQAGDGRKYIEDAIQKGAAAVIWDNQGFLWNPNWNIRNVAIPDLRLQAGYIASQFFNNPSEKMWCIGVTGTNGKTTVTHWLTQAFTHVEKKSAVVGTLGNGPLHALQETQNTTPGPVELQKLMADFVKQGIEVSAMEVSSHGLDQGRVNGMRFDVAVFTNISRDHLDYHQTMEAYQEAKRKLFEWKSLSACVINQDDAFGQQLSEQLAREGKRVLTYGIQRGDVRATDIHVHDTYIETKVITPYGKSAMKIHAVGEFNVYNALAVLATLLVSKVTLEQAVVAIEKLVSVQGRMQMFGGASLPLVVVDYAHTPDALEKVLVTLKAQTKSRLICVFGCGGDRDAGKRSLMGEAASRHADIVVVTNDNPRSEVPEKIIEAILAGVTGSYVVEADRAKAISTAVRSASAGDVVLVAGKGHENYQEIAGQKHYFSDAECVEQALARMQKS